MNDPNLNQSSKKKKIKLPSISTITNQPLNESILSIIAPQSSSSNINAASPSHTSTKVELPSLNSLIPSTVTTSNTSSHPNIEMATNLMGVQTNLSSFPSNKNSNMLQQITPNSTSSNTSYSYSSNELLHRQKPRTPILNPIEKAQKNKTTPIQNLQRNSPPTSLTPIIARTPGAMFGGSTGMSLSGSSAVTNMTHQLPPTSSSSQISSTPPRTGSSSTGVTSTLSTRDFNLLNFNSRRKNSRSNWTNKDDLKLFKLIFSKLNLKSKKPLSEIDLQSAMTEQLFDGDIDLPEESLVDQIISKIDIDVDSVGATELSVTGGEEDTTHRDSDDPTHIHSQKNQRMSVDSTDKIMSEGASAGAASTTLEIEEMSDELVKKLFWKFKIKIILKIFRNELKKGNLSNQIYEKK